MTVLGCVNLRSDAIDDPNVSYSAAVLEADDSGSEQVPVESSDVVGQQHVALVTQEDGTQQQVMQSLLRSQNSEHSINLLQMLPAVAR